MYEHRLQNLGINKELNKRHFKDQLLRHFVNAQEQSDGKNSIMVFEHGMKQMLKRSSQEYDYQEETLVLQKLPILCVVKCFHQIHTWFSFNGSFPQQCQQQSLPPKLKLLTSMLLTGGDIEDQQSTDTQACC